MENEIAILMAAGLGKRMRPLTEHTPKPLIKVKGKPMIETLIEGLRKRQVGDIYIVTGYLGEQFKYLCDRFEKIHVLTNSDYLSKNNISSVYTARNVLGSANCFICESDLYIADDSIFQKELLHSCYYGRMQKGYSGDWVFELQNGFINRVGIGGTDTFNMVGISYFKQKEANILREEVEKAYCLKESSDMFWDEVVNQNLDKLRLKIEPIEEGQLVEIDTVEELNKVNESR